MYQTDRDAFMRLLDQLAGVYGKVLTDEIRTSYWGALKDQPIGQVIALGNSHMRYGKHFPRPIELRPKDEKPPQSVGKDAVFMALEKAADKRAEELRKSDPEEWMRQVSPKVYEMGRAMGKTDAEISFKLDRALRDGVCVGPNIT